MTLIADASPLILLGKSSLLIKLVEGNKIIIPEKVYSEIIKGKEKAMTDAFLVDKLVKEKKIIVQKVDKNIIKKINEVFGLWAGEGEVLGLAIDTKFPIITDDKKCINSAKASNIHVITSLDVVIALYKRKKINKEKALNTLDFLEEYGWYKKEIIKLYKERIK